MRTSTDSAAHKIDGASWAAVFVWTGLSMMLNNGWGVGLLGIGVITLVAQLTRKQFGLPIEGFWMFAAALFVGGGLGAMFKIDLPLVPLALMLAGVAMFLSLFSGKGTPHPPA